MSRDKQFTPEHQLCCLCASWIAADCLDDFEGEPCHKICKAEGVGRAHKTRHVKPVQCCMTNESAIEGFCYFAETRREWDRCWDRCEKLPLSEKVTANIIRSWLDDLDRYGQGDMKWVLTREHFEALCRFALGLALSETRDILRDAGSAYDAGLEAAAKEVESHWNHSETEVNQQAQALRSAAMIRRLKRNAAPQDSDAARPEPVGAELEPVAIAAPNPLGWRPENSNQPLYEEPVLGIFQDKTMMVIMLDDEGWREAGSREMLYAPPTHWRRLPEPPK